MSLGQLQASIFFRLRLVLDSYCGMCVLAATMSELDSGLFPSCSTPLSSARSPNPFKEYSEVILRPLEGSSGESNAGNSFRKEPNPIVGHA